MPTLTELLDTERARNRVLSQSLTAANATILDQDAHIKRLHIIIGTRYALRSNAALSEPSKFALACEYTKTHRPLTVQQAMQYV